MQASRQRLTRHSALLCACARAQHAAARGCASASGCAGAAAAGNPRGARAFVLLALQLAVLLAQLRELGLSGGERRSTPERRVRSASVSRVAEASSQPPRSAHATHSSSSGVLTTRSELTSAPAGAAGERCVSALSLATTSACAAGVFSDTSANAARTLSTGEAGGVADDIMALGGRSCFRRAPPAARARARRLPGC